jgi:hypothetical protein
LCERPWRWYEHHRCALQKDATETTAKRRVKKKYPEALYLRIIPDARKKYSMETFIHSFAS